MNRILPILLIGLAAINPSFSQLKTVIDEDFSGSGSYIWSTGSWDNISSEVKNGEYIMTRTKETGYNYFETSKPIDPKEPFEIIINIQHVSGDNNAYGLAWGCHSEKTYYNLFALSRSGYYRISYKDKDDFVNLVEWTKSDAIISKGEYNEVKVIGDGKKVSFYINGTQVEKLNMPKIYGQNHGPYVKAQQVIKVKDFKLKKEEGEIQLTEHPFVDVPRVNLGEAINSPTHEVLPVISPDGTEIYFNRPGGKNNEGTGNYDGWKSTKDENGVWQKAVHLPSPINTPSNNSIVGVSAGGNSLIVAHVYDENLEFKEKGYSIIRKEGSGWGMPQKLDIPNYYNDDSKFTASVSANQKVLIFSGIRDDSQEEDIYVSLHQYGNKWSEPINIGRDVNGAGDEFAPFLASDNRTLYFSSNTHPGYGSADIFMSKRIGDGWTKWTKPKNLGNKINTKKWDSYFVIEASGKKAYMSSSESGFGKTDLFELTIPEELAPDPVIMMKGRVLNENSKKPVESEIILQYVTNNNEEVGHLISDPINGNYEAILPDTGYYEIFAKAHGYYAYKHILHTEQQNDFSVVEHDLYLVPLEKGQKIELKNIHFVRSKAEILPSSNHALDYLVEIMKENPELEILIGGHTDNTGSEKLNLMLSQNRAEKIRDYLIRNGISKKRLKAEGYGGSKPIASNLKEETRKLNRRVEFTIL